MAPRQEADGYLRKAGHSTVHRTGGHNPRPLLASRSGLETVAAMFEQSHFAVLVTKQATHCVASLRLGQLKIRFFGGLKDDVTANHGFIFLKRKGRAPQASCKPNPRSQPLLDSTVAIWQRARLQQLP